MAIWKLICQRGKYLKAHVSVRCFPCAQPGQCVSYLIKSASVIGLCFVLHGYGYGFAFLLYLFRASRFIKLGLMID